MANSHDSLAKEILESLLHPYGEVETEVEAPALVSQRADLLFAPSKERDEARRSLGLLGRMTDEVCLFEPFHGAPSLEDVIECLRKLLNHRHAGRLKSTVRRMARRSWMLCGGRPEGALEAL